jgi:transcriptional regulator with XRE-family HTH domain
MTMDVGERLRELRVSRRLTQVDLALAVGTSPTTISYVENGQRVPSFSLLEKLAEALDVEPVYLASRSGGQKKALISSSRR